MLQLNEIVIILLLALVLLGPRRLPGAARKMGQWTAEFKKAAQQMSEGIESEIAEAIQPLDQVRKDIADGLAEVDPRRYDWTGPKPATGPTPDDARADLDEIEGKTDLEGKG